MKALGVTLALAVALCPYATADQDFQGAEFDAARSLYDAIASVHMRADVKIQKDGVTGTGSFEYWAEGDKYRINCSTEPKLGLLGNVQYAFDGIHFQFLQMDIGTLTIKMGDSSELPTAVPNPFFLPVDYLDPNGDSCPGCALKLSDLRQGPKVHRTRSRGGPALKLRTSDRMIEWLREDGSVLSSISFFDRADATGQFPRRIVLRDFDEGAQERTEVEFLIPALEINTVLKPGIFEIPKEAASRIWREGDLSASH